MVPVLFQDSGGALLPLPPPPRTRRDGAGGVEVLPDGQRPQHGANGVGEHGAVAAPEHCACASVPSLWGVGPPLCLRHSLAPPGWLARTFARRRDLDVRAHDFSLCQCRAVQEQRRAEERGQEKLSARSPHPSQRVDHGTKRAGARSELHDERAVNEFAAVQKVNVRTPREPTISLFARKQGAPASSRGLQAHAAERQQAILIRLTLQASAGCRACVPRRLALHRLSGATPGRPWAQALNQALLAQKQ